MRTAILLSALLTALPAGAMDLTEGGEARCAIVLPDDAARIVAYAAEELQYFLQEMSGAEIPIVAAGECVSPEDGGPPHRVFIGDSDVAAELGLYTHELAPESIRILTAGDNLIIMGGDLIGPGDKDDPFSYNNQTGTLFAVYDLLQDQLGVRFLWPGELGTEIPSLPTITIPDLDIYEVPQIRQRKLRTAFKSVFLNRIEASTGPLDRGPWTASAEDTRVWLKRMRMGRNLFLNYGHAFTKWWEQYGEEHPEWFALTAERGVRGPVSDRVPDRVKMCVAEPTLWDAIIEKWQARREENPVVYQTLNACENDSAGWCTCEKCTAWDVPDYTITNAKGEEELVLSDRYCRFWNELAKRVAVIDPDAYVVAYTYSMYRFLPREVRLEPNIIVGFVPGVGYPNDGEGSRKFREDWQAWSSHGVKLFLRPNWLGGIHATPMPCMDQMADDFRFAAANGMIGTDYDTLSGMWCSSGPIYYLLARLHWDTTASTEQLLDEYYSAFGAAAPKVREYFDYWENFNRATWPKFTDRMLELGYGNMGRGRERAQPEVYTDEAIARGAKILLDAARLAENDSATVQERVEALRKAMWHAQMTVKAIAATEAINSGTTEDLDGDLQTIRQMHRYRLQIGAEGIINPYWAMWRDIKMGDYAGYKLVRDIGNRTGVALLAAKWRFRFDPDEVGEDERWFQRATLRDGWAVARTDTFWEDQAPGKQWLAEHGKQYDGLAWYRTGFTVDEKYKGQELVLFFGSVDEDAKIWINGQLIADHKMEGDDGWKTPFTVDITDAIMFGESNSLAVAVRDSSGKGGIYKRVWIMAE
jgi:hypothetical protein